MDKILAYQKVDGELFKLEKQINDSKYRTQMNKAKELANESKDNMIKLEQSAKKYYNSFLELQALIEKTLKNVEVLNQQKLDDMNLDKIKLFEKNSDKVNGNLQILQKNLVALQKTIKKQVADYNKSRDAIVKVKKQFASAKESYEKECELLQPKINELKSKLASMQLDLPENLFKKYQKARNDKIYPVFVPLTDNICGACRMEMASATLEAIKSGEMIECEHCRRIIYFKNK